MSDSMMLQGTMSDVGKSFITAALCRIFKEDGHSPSPFKSQNMALNSFVTHDGFEIGRAQALQAMAAGIEPSPLMNPILLKPTTDIGSQVIVNGKVLFNMKAADYFKYKTKLIPDILSAYNMLCEKHDIIVIEGAGSPVELNLKKDDIVNMGVAKLTNSPVILVGDIDRGGVFAQIVGTLELLEKDERTLVKGIIINKFRGDKTLFNDGIKILEDLTNKPVLGVIPYINCDLEDEDSLSHKLTDRSFDGIIDIAVIKLPKISNFTDFDVFSQYDGVSVRFVSKVTELGDPDLIIIPGTKSTISDMNWLKRTGLAEHIKHCFDADIPIFGICGGYQIMGKTISDPDNTECGGTVYGLGILNTETVFKNEKTQRRTVGTFSDVLGFFSCLSGASFYGYEIHMGETSDNGTPLTSCGGSFNNNAAGCYVHGIFDSADVCGRLVKKLYEAKGLTYTGGCIDRNEYRETQLDILSRNVRENLDIRQIYRIMREHNGT